MYKICVSICTFKRNTLLSFVIIIIIVIVSVPKIFFCNIRSDFGDALHALLGDNDQIRGLREERAIATGESP